MPKLVVPIEPDAYYTVTARDPGGTRIGIRHHVLGRDVAREKRSFRALAEEGARLVYEVTLEGSSPRALPTHVQPKVGIWALDSRRDPHLYKQPLPSVQQEHLTGLRVRLRIAKHNAEFYAAEAAKLRATHPNQSSKLESLLKQAAAWSSEATAMEQMLKQSEQVARTRRRTRG